MAVLLLLAVQSAQLGHAIASDGLALDELLYVASGYRHLALGDHRFGAEHPPLSRVLVAAPLLPLRLHVRDLSGIEAARGWYWAYDFFHVDNRDRPLRTLARAPVAALGLALSVLLWRWARAAGGPEAGIAALVLAAFHPSLLAHGHLATTDMAGAFTFVLASWAMWRWMAAPHLGRAILVGTAVGLAIATRLTGILLVPVFAILVAAGWSGPGTGSTGRRGLRPLGVLAAAVAVLAPLVIWAAYGFRHAPWPGEAMPRVVPAEWLAVLEGNPAARLLSFLEAARVLPAAYLASLEVHLVKSLLGHESYLLGQISHTGWPHYYLVAVLAKSTPGFLLGMVVAAAFGRRGRPRPGLAAHWVLPAATLFVAASLGKVQAGERYVLPVHAYLILLMAFAVPALLRERGGRAILAAVVLLHAGPALLAARGGYLGYFNVLVGGRTSGHLVLADSNLDWGQDLPRLAEWMRRSRVDRVQLAYWGTDDPDRYGIAREDLPGGQLYPGRPAARPFTGVVAVSPTLLVGLAAPREMPGGYRRLLARRPDDRAGGFFIYRFPAAVPDR